MFTTPVDGMFEVVSYNGTHGSYKTLYGARCTAKSRELNNATIRRFIGSNVKTWDANGGLKGKI